MCGQYGTPVSNFKNKNSKNLDIYYVMINDGNLCGQYNIVVVMISFSSSQISVVTMKFFVLGSNKNHLFSSAMRGP